MPELPEVENVRRSLEPAILGRRIDRVVVRRADVVRAAPAEARTRALGQGDTPARTLRHGKQLAIEMSSGRVVVVHLGMSGQLLALPPGRRPERADHVHVRWTLQGGGSLLFRDPRRFGGIWAVPSRERLETERWNTLGPDALSVRADRLRAAAGASARAIKACLLDQTVVAGVGNIYADEALFLARTHPLTPACLIEDEGYRAIAHAVRRVLRRGIDLGGATLRDYVNASSERGRAQTRFGVYGRGGQGCGRCGEALVTIRVVQRTTTLCPGCQPAPSA